MNRKILFISALTILILSLGFFIYFYFNSYEEDPNSVSYEQKESDISIESLNPPREAQNVGVHEAITVQFSRSLTLEEQEFVSFTSDPPLSVSYEWENARSLTLTHTQPLWSETEYSFQITYPYSFSSWNATTQSNEDIPIEDIIKSQSEADRHYGSWMKNIQDKLPWYDELPLTTSDYYVYFNVDKNVFIAKIYIKQSSSISEEVQFQNGQDEVIRALSELSIPINEYEIEWIREEVE